MNRLLREIVIILAISFLAGIVNNSISGSRVAWVGSWPSFSDSEDDSTWDCLSCVPGDPPQLSLAEASALYQNPEIVFIDARHPEEYEAGHIQGSLLLSIEEDDNIFEPQWEEVRTKIDTSTTIVTYCSGAECESSLFLARYLRDDLGYPHVKIFFGGWRRWSAAGLPIDGEAEGS